MSKPEDIREMRVFDYLEGNLSPEEVIEFDNDMLLHDSYLKEELSDWEKTYLIADHFDTSKLEAQIIEQTSASYSILSYLNLFLLLSLTFIAGHQIQSNQISIIDELSSLQFKSIEPTQLSYKQPIEANITQGVLNSSLQSNLSENGDDRYNDVVLNNDAPDVFVLSIDKMKFRRLDKHELEPVVMISLLKTSSKSSVRKVSRHEARVLERQTRRYKAKELQRRQAIQFMKGNTPYVVPIDMKRF